MNGPADTIQVHFLTGKGVAFIRLYGRVDGSDLIASIRSVLTSDDWSRGNSTLWDGRAITELVVSPEDVADIALLAEELSHRRGTGKTAVVTYRDIDLMMAELLQHTLPFFGPFRTFYRLADAASWLDVPVAELPPTSRGSGLNGVGS